MLPNVSAFNFVSRQHVHVAERQNYKLFLLVPTEQDYQTPQQVMQKRFLIWFRKVLILILNFEENVQFSRQCSLFCA